MIAREIMDRAALLLADAQNVRWTRATLLDLVNEGVRQVVLVRPDASTRVQSVQLSPGSRQDLPSGGLRLLAVLRNMGADGQSPGQAVRLVERAALDASAPDWNAAGAESAITEYLYDLRRPGVYHVYPPLTGTGPVYAEIAYSASPRAVTDEEAPLGLDEVYAGPILDWVLYRAFHADIESPAGRARAEHHFQAFYRALEQKTQSDAAVAPSSGSNA